ncbi:ABC transporter permease [Neorhizobium galegae]|uniref:ABC transporter permease n=1 Tax=Neorhizobium galegae TaxID=399 RepID=UPI00062167A3|nr:ABC transporter permease [Neorhizobium galegae]CDZ60722.1 ABC-type dipeptide/oligopeptide/nickel transport system, permease component [Neorhizobium galegae bv. orientalis]KAB1121692.1 ABC transporter permease [Neorhizobium galegae]MCQ1574689.1 ABC transporter permease [Neorhizobium galegae]MCQ1807939.1 ABC transporter permease [Neorhizobium galegae]MCQ1835126.1 ABC transporter permease [Neorhizobium galegae]
MKRVSPILVFAIVILAITVIVAIIGNVFTTHGVSQQNLLARLKPPAFMTGSNPSFPLGTDRIGRDMVARVIAGLQMSLSVAIAGTIIGAVFGSVVGFISAHFRGWVEEVLMMLVDFQASLPFILITLTLLAFFGNSMTLFIILMGLFGWEKYARLSRGVVLSAINQPYAKAIVALGAGNGRLYLKHVLPNVASALIVQVTLTFPQIILLETSLSFLGLGIQAPQTSLGQILGDGRDYLSTAWWISVWPGSVIFLVTLSMSIVGDWLRDRLDPMLRARTT